MISTLKYLITKNVTVAKVRYFQIFPPFQMYELCLLDYDFLILNTPFLVHRPGIKTKEIHDKNENKEMVAKQNKFITSVVLPELVKIH